jgi:hypothetical protein
MTFSPWFLWFVPDDSCPVHSGAVAHRSLSYSRCGEGKSTARLRNFAFSAIYNREELRFPADPPQGSENHYGEDGGDGEPTPKLVHAVDSNTWAQSRGPIGCWISDLGSLKGQLNIRIAF